MFPLAVVCAVIVKKLNLQTMENVPKTTWDNNHYNYINNILYSKIKYFASKHVSIILFLCVHYKNEIQNMIFQKEIDHGSS